VLSVAGLGPVPISGAADRAGPPVVVGSNVKKVPQQPEPARRPARLGACMDGDSVKAGDIVVRPPTRPWVKASPVPIVVQDAETGCGHARAALKPNSAGLDKIKFPPALLDQATIPTCGTSWPAETKLFGSCQRTTPDRRPQYCLRRRHQLNEKSRVSRPGAVEKTGDIAVSKGTESAFAASVLHDQASVQISR